MAREKSIKDINEQAQRIYAADRARNGGHYNSPLQQKVQQIANRYVDNLVRNRGKLVKAYGDGVEVRQLNPNKKYARSARLGTSAG